MRYELALVAYDVMDQVHVSTVLYRSADTPGEPRQALLRWHSSLQGTGESDPREWAIDALLGALEDV
jgi:hypothetical protein